MPKYLKSEYSFVKFERGKYPKKYNAILRNKETKREVKVPFGDQRYEQYFDKALGLYSKKNHKDKMRRAKYRNRHSKEKPTFKDYWSAGLFSWKYLW